MTKVKFVLLTLLGSLYYVQNVKAAPLMEVPKEDTDYKYYLGVGEKASSYTEAINQAFEQAVSDAIRDNYGFEASISADTYLTEQNSQLLKRFRQKSQTVKLKGFERVDMKLENKNEKYSIYLLYKYSKREIEFEKLSLRTAKDPLPLENFSEFGGDKKNNLGGLEIVTDPAGAFIYVNDEPYLKSPLKVQNQIAPGKYNLTLDHPLFETIKEEISVLPNEVTRITKTLVPAFGQLKIETEPSAAEVFINNKSIGKTPITDIKMQAGVIFKLRIEHPLALTQTFENISVDKNQTRFEKINLKLKPGRLQLIVENKPDAIFIEGEKVLINQRIFERPSGYYTIKAEKEGYDNYSETIEIEPNTTLTKKISLTKTTARKPDTLVKPAETTTFQSWSFRKFYFQGTLSMETMGSPIADTKNQTIGGQSDLSFGHPDYIGFFTSTTTYKKTDRNSNYAYSPGDIASVKKTAMGVWIYTISSSDDSDFLQLGYFEEKTKISQYLPYTYDNELTEALSGKLVDYNGRGLVLRYCHIGQNSLTFDLRLGVVAYKPVQENNLKTQGSVFLSLGVGWDMARTMTNWGR